MIESSLWCCKIPWDPPNEISLLWRAQTELLELTKDSFKELIFCSILICWDIYIAKSLQPKKVIVLDNNDCCKGWTLNGTLQNDFSSAIFAEPKPFCKVPLRVHPLPHSFLSTKRTIYLFETRFEIPRVLAICRNFKIQNRTKNGRATDQNVKV